jgi:hypothetical protein
MTPHDVSSGSFVAGVPALMFRTVVYLSIAT